MRCNLKNKILAMKYTLKFRLRDICECIKLAVQYLLFPHILAGIIILMLAILSLRHSYLLMTNGQDYWSSVFANISAGLITGIVICLVGGIKQITIMKTQLKIQWLDEMGKKLSEFFDHYHKFYELGSQKLSGDSEELFNMIYDIGCRANWVNEAVIQSSFDKRLLFNPQKYCKKHLKYDADALASDFEELHENLKMLDIDCTSSRQILQHFDKVKHHLQHLSREIWREKQALQVRLSRMQSTLI